MNSYQIKVELDDASPRMYRKLLIPANITFNQLHKIIQCAFGFQNYHLFEFSSENIKFSKIDKIDDTFAANKSIHYVYDFGDSWDTTITIEKTFDEQIDFPICLECVGPNPVEDSGGVYGFADFLKILNNPYHPEYEGVKDYLETMGFKEIININKLNDELKKCIRVKTTK